MLSLASRQIFEHDLIVAGSPNAPLIGNLPQIREFGLLPPLRPPIKDNRS
jgi:hypothetical protein